MSPLCFRLNLEKVLDLGANATIFEICAAIDAGVTVDIAGILAALELEITPLVTAQITGQITNVVQVLNATGVTVDAALLTAIIAGLHITAIVDEISLDIEASLALFNNCRGVPTPPPTPGGGGAGGLVGFQIPTVHSMNPTIQQNSPVLPSSDSMLQFRWTLSPIL